MYYLLLRDSGEAEIDVMQGFTVAETNGPLLKASHPRMIYPSQSIVVGVPAAAVIAATTAVRRSRGGMVVNPGRLLVR